MGIAGIEHLPPAVRMRGSTSTSLKPSATASGAVHPRSVDRRGLGVTWCLGQFGALKGMGLGAWGPGVSSHTEPEEVRLECLG